MSGGIRATVGFENPGSCPVAHLSATAEGPIQQVSTSISLSNGDGSVSEFLAREATTDRDDVRAVFDYGNSTLYRTDHDGSVGCPCELLGSYGCPIHRYDAEDGRLTLIFHVEAFETLQAVMDDLQTQFSPVDVQRLLQPPLEGTPDERVFVNRGRLTDRQLEVLETAYEMGYFERPKRANATEVADRLDIAQSTVTEHLMAAQRKLLEDVLD